MRALCMVEVDPYGVLAREYEDIAAVHITVQDIRPVYFAQSARAMVAFERSRPAPRRCWRQAD